ncbi:hypothetical protein ACJIZ3_024361 [Penstemon smallii]|uniref:Phytosulfokine n=1 Tax=Penstemon smallii TaxID=265156 RepID=A0ABD3TU22_9LAMI
MKQISKVSIISIILLLIISHTSARLLPPHQGDNPGIKLNEITLHQENDFSSLMGLEECEDKDDEACHKRRMVAEAHLDYIYTQHHKP